MPISLPGTTPQTLSVLLSMLYLKSPSCYPIHPHSCSYCRKLVINSQRGDQILQVYKSVKDILKASRRCQFIRILLHQNLPNDFYILGPKERYELIILLNWDEEDGNIANLWGARLMWRRNEKETLGRIFAIHTLAGDPASGCVLSRPQNSHPSSERTFDLARTWIYACDRTHSNCREGGSILPLRVLDLYANPGSDDLRLLVCHSPRPKAQYAALSYCWGSGVPRPGSATTKKILEQRTRSIFFAGLPATLRDAISVTRNLGVRYLWIDYLCIVQDDPQDVKVQISEMPTIYQNAYITISAAAAHNIYMGFLKDRVDPSIEEDMKFSLPISFEDRDKGCIVLTPLKFENFGSRDPIDTRGWTMQEYMLSRRILIYGSQQTRWACQTVQYTDGGRNSNRIEIPLPVIDIPKLPQLTPKFLIPRARKSSWTWDQVIEEYSKRKLTFPGDKLVAIAAIASEYSRISGEHYVAGLWHGGRNGLVKQLLWVSERMSLRPRPPSYCAPSWSWASVDSPVLCGVMRTEDFYSVSPTIRTVDCKAVDSLLPFGAVHSSFILWEAYVQEAKVVRVGEDYLLSTGTSLVWPKASFDTFIQKTQIMEKFSQSICLIISSAQPYRFAGLILVAIDESRFRREGVWEFTVIPQGLTPQKWVEEKKKWFESCKRQTLFIV